MKKFVYGLITLISISYHANTVASECMEEDYKLVWSDEFDYTGLPDKVKWNYEEGYLRNKELQYYQVESLEHSYVKDGFLTLEANYTPSLTHPYKSASLKTENRATWRYGKIEVRASLPTAPGTWPAIWMMGENIRQVYWPRTGEIDIMEHVGKHPNRVHANVIYYDYEEEKKKAKNNSHITIDSVQSFNTYAIKWTEDEIIFLLNDVPYHRFDIDEAGGEKNPFRKPFYLILNLALGSWGGELEDDFSSAKFIIDYVRVYQQPCF
ncbi:glycoside hydrolase family 16 protein [Vibrio sp. 10N.261.55.A7]|uniref:glycoside hydrolase family 16 protein n=1 Tax=Vibrio TaxID=662 RepID=UPI000C8461B8|nr:glycoside hydrolase family 16 protein [Vibrio sp. 10N.261.55.A7]PMJ99785.1 hypothetical protein BCU12_20695 [Vibrio sp. 10N.261.55.A7]